MSKLDEPVLSSIGNGQEYEVPQAVTARRRRPERRREASGHAAGADPTPAFWSGVEVASPPQKRLISLRIDVDVINWFRNQGSGYQTRMNQILRSYMEYSADQE